MHKIDLDAFLRAARELIRFDEVERALLLLNNLPAYFRDFEPKEVFDLKQKILAAQITAHAYGNSGLDAQVTEDKALTVLHNTLRGQILKKEMNELVLKGIKPHIVDVGPGEYFVPIGLQKLGCDFTYNPVSMDKTAAAVAAPNINHVFHVEPRPDTPTLFIALEIIEHLPSTQDLSIEALRHCGKWPEYVHLSTPLYTFDPSDKDWDKLCGLPHLRAYTPREFILEAQRLFPGYNWEYKSDSIQSLRGYKTGSAILGEL